MSALLSRKLLLPAHQWLSAELFTHNSSSAPPSRFELSQQLEERIKLQLRHRSSYGMLVQFVVGLLCPCPGVQQTAAWDYGASHCEVPHLPVVPS